MKGYSVHGRIYFFIALLIAAMVMSAMYSESAVEHAMAQEEADLQATVEALQARVTEQDERIASLEDEVNLLKIAISQILSESNNEPSSSSRSQDQQTITGSISILSTGASSVVDENFFWFASGDSKPCSGRGGFDDLEGQMQVVVTDSAGATIAAGRTEAGEYHEFEDVCRFNFAVSGVPEADFYTLRVSRREGPTYSRAELEAMDWNVELTIG